MGAIQAAEFAQMDVDIETALGWHLQGNHYPPIPLSMVQPCIDAIDAYWDDDLDREIALPDGVLFKGMETAPAREMIIQHHLYAWCENDDE